MKLLPYLLPVLAALPAIQASLLPARSNDEAVLQARAATKKATTTAKTSSTTAADKATKTPIWVSGCSGTSKLCGGKSTCSSKRDTLSQSRAINRRDSEQDSEQDSEPVPHIAARNLNPSHPNPLHAARQLIARTDATYGTLSKPDAETAAALTSWTPAALAKATILDLGSNIAGRPPTSQFIQWSSSDAVAAVTGLYGCVSVVVVSRCGVYMSHHWENTVSDPILDENPIMFANAFTNALAGSGAATFTQSETFKKNLPSYAGTDATKQAAFVKEMEAETKTAYPSQSSWKSLKSQASCFAKDDSPKAAIVYPKSGSATKYTSTGSLAKMQAAVKAVVPEASIHLVGYAVVDGDATNSESKTSANGKVIVTFSPKTGAANLGHAYKVYMAGASTKAVLEDAWKSS